MCKRQKFLDAVVSSKFVSQKTRMSGEFSSRKDSQLTTLRSNKIKDL